VENVEGKIKHLHGIQVGSRFPNTRNKILAAKAQLKVGTQKVWTGNTAWHKLNRSSSQLGFREHASSL
jgi:hypothetical protein